MGTKSGQRKPCRKTPVKGKGPAKEKASATEKASAAEMKPLQPSQCRAYMRRTLAKEFHGIVEGFVKGAKAGSCQHVKLATELLEPRTRKAKKPTGRGTLGRWLDEIERGV